MKDIGIIFSILLLLITIQSTIYYLVIRRIKFIEWLFFNACAPSNLAYLIGFVVLLITNDLTIIYLGLLPMFFFGTLGMFVLPWKGMNIIPQVGHLIMTLNLGWLIIFTFKVNSFREVAIGLLLSIFVFSIFISMQQMYVKNHPEDFKRILLME